MDILFVDKDIVVCVKPVGLDSEHGVPEELKNQFGGEIYTLHRLDMNVGGVMVYARSKEAASSLSAQIQRGEMVKEYVALVHGTPPECGDWEDLLFKDSRRNKVFVVDRQRSGVKKARLEFKRLREGEESLVRIRLHTGRSHQIRVQLTSRGVPRVGDHKSGGRSERTAPMLYSCSIAFSWKDEEKVYTFLPDWA